MYVEFMKNFHLTCWKKLMAVRLISASRAQKRLIASFYTCSASSSWKIFFLPIRTSQWLLDSFRPPEPKSVWILLSRHDVRRLHEKFSSRRFVREWLLDSFPPPELKNVWFLLSRHDVRRVDEKFSSRRFERAIGCFRLISASCAQKRLVPTF